MLYPGLDDHQLSICSKSVVASLNPFGVAGFLRSLSGSERPAASEIHGKTGMPASAYRIAARCNGDFLACISPRQEVSPIAFTGSRQVTYSIREVDADDEDIVEALDHMHDLVFGHSAPRIDHALPLRWWFVRSGDGATVGFGGITPSRSHLGKVYMYRSGVVKAHRGHGLQRRLLRVRERASQKMGWSGAVTDTADNVHSSNNLIAAGYKIFQPRYPWSFKEAIYWRKNF